LDWVLVFMDDNHAQLLGSTRSAKSFRMIRVLRVLRLLRLLKIASMSSEFEAYVRSEVLLLAFGIARLLAVVVLVNHWIACAWYAIGSRVSAANSWPLAMERRDPFASVLGVDYRYLTALHWSVTQFTPASMEIVPTNKFERCFSICVIIFALVVFSSVVSSITTATSCIRSINEKRRSQEELLRRYITENRVSFAVGALIYSYIRHKAVRRRVHASEVAALAFLPNILQMQLHTEVYAPSLLQHPWFACVDAIDNRTIVEVCHKAMGDLSFTAGNQLFNYGGTCRQMYVVVTGTFDYYYKEDDDFNKVRTGRVSEPVLWVKWIHRGRLVAVVDSEVMVLGVDAFQNIIQSTQRMLHCGRVFAQQLVDYLSDQLRQRKRISDIYSSADREHIASFAKDAFEQHLDSLEEARLNASLRSEE